MKIRRTILGLLAFASLQTASATDLMQIYQQALMNDTQFAAAQLRYKALRQSPIARSLLLPRAKLCTNAARDQVLHDNLIYRPVIAPSGQALHSQ